MKVVQPDKVTECPGDLITVAFEIAVTAIVCLQVLRKITGDRWFFGKNYVHGESCAK